MQLLTYRTPPSNFGVGKNGKKKLGRKAIN